MPRPRIRTRLLKKTVETIRSFRDRFRKCQQFFVTQGYPDNLKYPEQFSTVDGLRSFAFSAELLFTGLLRHEFSKHGGTSRESGAYDLMDSVREIKNLLEAETAEGTDMDWYIELASNEILVADIMAR